MQNNNGDTPLHLAVRNQMDSDYTMAYMLEDAGCDKTIRNNQELGSK